MKKSIYLLMYFCFCLFLVSCSNSNSEVSSTHPSQSSTPWDGEQMDQPDPNAQLSVLYDGTQCEISFAKEPTVKVEDNYVQNGLGYNFYDQLMERTISSFMTYKDNAVISIESSVKIDKVLDCTSYKLTKNGNNYEKTQVSLNWSLKTSKLEVDAMQNVAGIYIETSFVYLTAENKGYIYHVAALVLFD